MARHLEVPPLAPLGQHGLLRRSRGWPAHSLGVPSPDIASSISPRRSFSFACLWLEVSVSGPMPSQVLDRRMQPRPMPLRSSGLRTAKRASPQHPAGRRSPCAPAASAPWRDGRSTGVVAHLCLSGCGDLHEHPRVWCRFTGESASPHSVASRHQSIRVSCGAAAA